MFLRSITIRGFKSFADKTVLEFIPGVSVIVGPNGSGKSNLVDAISWVLGEQGARSLRGGHMADTPAAIAMCHHGENNSSTDAVIVPAGSNGIATCAAFRVGGTCRETHYVHHDPDGSGEGTSNGAAGCSQVAEYSNPYLTGFWACSSSPRQGPGRLSQPSTWRESPGRSLTAEVREPPTVASGCTQ